MFYLQYNIYLHMFIYQIIKYIPISWPKYKTNPPKNHDFV